MLTDAQEQRRDTLQRQARKDNMQVINHVTAVSVISLNEISAKKLKIYSYSINKL